LLVNGVFIVYPKEVNGLSTVFAQLVKCQLILIIA